MRAKVSSGLAEHLITLGKNNTLAAKRQAYKVLLDHSLVSKLFGEVAPVFKNRQSGFTRILKLGLRRGDGAQMALLELTEKPAQEKKLKKQKSAAVHEHPVKAEEKPHMPKEEKPKMVEEKKPAKKFFGGLKGFFKKERDSL